MSRNTINRKSHEISLDEFKRMSKSQAKQYTDLMLLNKTSFDATKKFQFEFSSFISIMEGHGFSVQKTVVDKKPEPNTHFVFISHRRSDEEVVRKSLSLPKSTADKLDNLFKDECGNAKVTQLEQSKIVNVLFDEFLDQIIKEQKNRTLSVMYQVEENYTLI